MIYTTFSDHTGFYHDTVLSEVGRFGYGNSFFFISKGQLAGLVVGVVVLCGIHCFIKIGTSSLSAFRDPFSLVFILLIMVWAVNILEVYVCKTSYLDGRTALMYYVLFIFVLLFRIRDMSEKKVSTWITITLLLLFFVLNFSRAVNLKSVYEWSYDAYTYDVLDYMNDYRHKHPDIKSIEMNSSWLFNPSFSFYTSTGKFPWLEITDTHEYTDTASQTLFYYATKDDASRLLNYTPVKLFTPTGIVPGCDTANILLLMIHK